MVDKSVPLPYCPTLLLHYLSILRNNVGVVVEQKFIEALPPPIAIVVVAKENKLKLAQIALHIYFGNDF